MAPSTDATGTIYCCPSSSHTSENAHYARNLPKRLYIKPQADTLLTKHRCFRLVEYLASVFLLHLANDFPAVIAGNNALTVARFQSYSFGNGMLIARQKPTATRVAGIRTWNSLGRFVKRGEKGILILAPMIGRKKPTDGIATEIETDNTADERKLQQQLYGFRTVLAGMQSAKKFSTLVHEIGA